MDVTKCPLLFYIAVASVALWLRERFTTLEPCRRHEAPFPDSVRTAHASTNGDERAVNWHTVCTYCVHVFGDLFGGSIEGLQ